MVEDVEVKDAREIDEPVPVIAPVKMQRKDQQYLMDDPEVREKFKQLQLAKLDRQIAEERAELIDYGALGTFIASYKMLLRFLHICGSLSDSEFELVDIRCPWCGGLFEYEEDSKTDIRSWKCIVCNKSIECPN